MDQWIQIARRHRLEFYLHEQRYHGAIRVFRPRSRDYLRVTFDVDEKGALTWGSTVTRHGNPNSSQRHASQVEAVGLAEEWGRESFGD